MTKANRTTAKKNRFCPQCKKPIEAANNLFSPFCSKRCKMVDLEGWFSEQYVINKDEDDGPEEK